MAQSLIEKTLATFGPLAERPLSGEDAESIVANMTGLFELLEGWASNASSRLQNGEGRHEA